MQKYKNIGNIIHYTYSKSEGLCFYLIGYHGNPEADEKLRYIF